MELSSIYLFFNIGAPELFIVVLVVIIFFGSKKIPELMRGLGKGMREFKNATGEIQHEIRKSAQEIEKDLSSSATSSKTKPDIKNKTQAPEKDSNDSEPESGNKKS